MRAPCARTCTLGLYLRVQAAHITYVCPTSLTLIPRWAYWYTLCCVCACVCVCVQIIISVALGRQLTRTELTALSDDFTVWLRELFTATPYDTWPFPMHESMNARRRLVAYLQDQVCVCVRERV